LKKRLGYVLGNKSASKRQDPETLDEEEEFVSTTKSESTFTSSSKSSSSVDEDEDDDALSYFQKLAES